MHISHYTHTCSHASFTPLLSVWDLGVDRSRNRSSGSGVSCLRTYRAAAEMELASACPGAWSDLSCCCNSSCCFKSSLHLTHHRLFLLGPPIMNLTVTYSYDITCPSLLKLCVICQWRDGGWDIRGGAVVYKGSEWCERFR